MNPQTIIESFSELPPKAQKQVADFIDLLKVSAQTEKQGDSLSQSPFVGMWKDRTDMQNSSLWVRELRNKEWN